MQTRVKLINNEDAYNTNYTIEMHAIKLRQTSSICLGPTLTYYRPKCKTFTISHACFDHLHAYAVR